MQIKKNLMRGLTAVGMSAVMLLGTAQVAMAYTSYTDCYANRCSAMTGRNLSDCTAFCGDPRNISGTSGAGSSGGSLGTIDTTRLGFFQDFKTVFQTALTIVFVLAAILVFAFLIMGGVEWITSGGEKSKTEAARNKITAAIVGLVIIVASWALMNLVLRIVTGGVVTDLNGALNLLP